MSVQFPSIRDVPQSGVPQWQAEMLNQIKEAVELMSGARGSSTRAVMNANLPIQQYDYVTMKRVTAVAPGAYSQQEFLNLMNNVQELAGNVVSLQAQVNELIKQLRS